MKLNMIIIIIIANLLIPLGKFLWTGSCILGAECLLFNVLSRDNATSGQESGELEVEPPTLRFIGDCPKN